MSARLNFNVRLLDLLHVCCQMREDEQQQYLAVTGLSHYDPDVAAAMFWNLPGVKAVLLDDENRALAIGGYQEVAAGVWQSWMVGSPEAWERHWRAITKGSIALMDLMFDEFGARRLQTNSIASRTRAIDWYVRGLKMRPEGVMRGYGANGEDVATFALLKSERRTKRGQ
ncbi:hypothetical protein [Coralloluteibacterium thermophilus]|uniref:N-acetyltransferase n=1 Tax=Coralloluteibacterium thermophilum TaxID=2707049 RepID=A0ABV9NI53_9GAMM